jgi:hypothetical protein
VCGTDARIVRIRCATLMLASSGFTVRHAPDYAVIFHG